MKRKLIKQGKSALTITLPSKWVEKNNLNAGDEIEVMEKDNILSFSQLGLKEEKKEIEIALKSDYETYIRLMITAAYRMGFDVINVNFGTEKQFSMLQKAISERLIGYEITEKKQNLCKIESIAEPPEDKVDVIVKRIFYIIKDTSNTLLEFLKNKSHLDLGYIEKQTHKQDQYSFFCRRTLSKKGFEEKSHSKWMLLSYLNLMQHGYFRVIDYIVKKKIKLSRRFIELLERANNYFSLFLEAYFKKDITAFSRIDEIGETLIYKHCYKLFEENKEGVAVYHLSEVIRYIYLCSIPAMAIFMSYNASEE